MREGTWLTGHGSRVVRLAWVMNAGLSGDRVVWLGILSCRLDVIDLTITAEYTNHLSFRLSGEFVGIEVECGTNVKTGEVQIRVLGYLQAFGTLLGLNPDGLIFLVDCYEKANVFLVIGCACRCPWVVRLSCMWNRSGGRGKTGLTCGCRSVGRRETGLTCGCRSGGRRETGLTCGCRRGGRRETGLACRNRSGGRGKTGLACGCRSVGRGETGLTCGRRSVGRGETGLTCGHRSGGRREARLTCGRRSGGRGKTRLTCRCRQGYTCCRHKTGLAWRRWWGIGSGRCWGLSPDRHRCNEKNCEELIHILVGGGFC